MVDCATKMLWVATILIGNTGLSYLIIDLSLLVYSSVPILWFRAWNFIFATGYGRSEHFADLSSCSGIGRSPNNLPEISPLEKES